MVPESLPKRKSDSSSSLSSQSTRLPADNQPPSLRLEPQPNPRIWSPKRTLGPKTQCSTAIVNSGPWRKLLPRDKILTPAWNSDPPNQYLPQILPSDIAASPRIEPCTLGINPWPQRAKPHHLQNKPGIWGKFGETVFKTSPGSSYICFLNTISTGTT